MLRAQLSGVLLREFRCWRAGDVQRAQVGSRYPYWQAVPSSAQRRAFAALCPGGVYTEFSLSKSLLDPERWNGSTIDKQRQGTVTSGIRKVCYKTTKQWGYLGVLVSQRWGWGAWAGHSVIHSNALQLSGQLAEITAPAVSVNALTSLWKRGKRIRAWTECFVSGNIAEELLYKISRSF